MSNVENSSNEQQFEILKTFKQDIQIQLTLDVTAQSSQLTTLNCTDGTSKISELKITNVKSVPIEDMKESLEDEKPLDLSIRKSTKTFYILDSDEENETITIDSDDDDEDHKRNIYKLNRAL